MLKSKKMGEALTRVSDRESDREHDKKSGSNLCQTNVRCVQEKRSYERAFEGSSTKLRARALEKPPSHIKSWHPAPPQWDKSRGRRAFHIYEVLLLFCSTPFSCSYLLYGTFIRMARPRRFRES